MADDLQHETAANALCELMTHLAEKSVEVSGEMGVEFDVDDPRVARWLMLTTFEGLFMQSPRSTTAELLKRAEEASRGESRSPPRRRKKGGINRPLVTWDDLVASSDAIEPASRVKLQSKP